jgi:BNR repeat-like domain
MSAMREANVLSQGVIFRDPYTYASHPHVALAADGELVVVFNQTRRNRFIFHPPHDPQYRNTITRSADGGRTWSAPQVAPHYGFSGTECASLTTLANGRMLLNQWRFRWYPLGLAQAGAVPEPVHYPEEFVCELIESGELDTGGQIAPTPEDFAPWARGHGECWVHASDDHGQSFTESMKIDTGPFHGGYGLRGCLELGDGTLLLPLNDIPKYRTIFTVRSQDGGQSWQEPNLVARKEGYLFTEPALVQTRSGDILCMMRDDATRIMHSCRSSDGGKSWSEPKPTGVDGYPPHLLALPDGRILCSFGMRMPEYSIRAVLSEDGGKSWQLDKAIRIRGKLPNRDLGYPVTVLLADGSLFSVYYCQDDGGVTGVEFTNWRL